MKNRTKYSIIAIAALLVVAAVVIFLHQLLYRERPAAFLDGYPITQTELRLSRESLGENAQETDVLKLAVYRKGIQILAAQEGSTAPVDYQDVCEEVKRRNTDAANNQQKGDVVYGITTCTAETYYSYLLEQARLTVENSLLEDALQDKDRLYQIYEQNKEDLFAQQLSFDQVQYDCAKILVNQTFKTYLQDSIEKMEYKGPPIQ